MQTRSKEEMRCSEGILDASQGGRGEGNEGKRTRSFSTLKE